MPTTAEEFVEQFQNNAWERIQLSRPQKVE
jgi:hypothetical protein